MAFGRRTRSLARTAAQTAVIAGTASATSNAVHARAAQRQAAAQPPVAPEVVQPPAAQQPVAPEPGVQAVIQVVIAAATATDDPIARLERVLALHQAGALTDAEFDALKAIAIR